VAVRQGEQDRVVSGQPLHSGIGQDPLGERDEVRVVLAETASGVAARRQLTDLDLRVAEQQPKQLATCVPARSRYRDPECHLDYYARSCNFIQGGATVWMQHAVTSAT
jgi:hypothetical protein